MPYLYSAFSKLSCGISVTCTFLRFSVNRLQSEIHKFHAETGSVDAERHELRRRSGKQNVTTTCTYKYMLHDNFQRIMTVFYSYVLKTMKDKKMEFAMAQKIISILS